MPDVPIPRDLEDFLRRPNPAVVATVRADGSPHTAATWYEWDDGLVLLNMDRSRVRLRHLQRDPRASLTILDEGDWYRQVTLLGRVVRIADDPDLRDIDRLSERYRGVPYARRDRDSVSAWLEPERWYGWSRGAPWAGEARDDR